MNHREKISRWIRPGAVGVEIGAFKSPLPGFSPPPFYVDCFDEFGGEKVHADYFGHACALPFRDDSLDYVVTSHVLEHVANPIAAFAEWHRVLRHGGIVYLLVPDRRYTWDRPRRLTPVSHLLEDFERGTTACDATHIDDFVFGVDWVAYSPGTPASSVDAERAARALGMHDAVAREEEINIHFHTFEPANVLELFARLRTWPRARFDWEIVDQAERFPAENPIGLLVVARITKPWLHRFAGWRHQRRTARDPKFPLRPDARAFADYAATSATLSRIRGCLDEPVEHSTVDPEQLRFRGWLWHGSEQDNIVAIEVWVDGVRAGETAEFISRPDVVTALGLASDARAGFEFIVQPKVKPGARFLVQLRARLRDGKRLHFVTRYLTTLLATDYA